MELDQIVIEDEILKHFGNIFRGSRNPVEETDIEVDSVQAAIDDIDQILLEQDDPSDKAKYKSIVCEPFEKYELDDILNKLASGKSAGFDNISNEMLKCSNTNFREYLKIFLNKILESGKVPKELNIGKCMLVFKVSILK